MADYRIASSKLQDVANKTLFLTAKASDLGTVAATTITIPLAHIAYEDIDASDVLKANNLTDVTAAVASISGSNLILTAGGATTFAATDVIELVIKLK